MLKSFWDFAEKERLFNNGSRLLLAVSGGVDSMVMARLFRDAGIRHSIAHCNFSLRGKESDGDEEFVAEYARVNNIPFFSIRFDTLGYAASKKISVQMAARELRYEWFGTIVRREGFDAVAVAHNLNDNVETFLINLLRGTGLSGLTGMDSHRDPVIRPLLFASRAEILAFASSDKIDYREDSSNKEVKYTRNRIRHNVIPEMEKVNPGVLNAITDTMKHLSSASGIIDTYIDHVMEDMFIPVQDGFEVDISTLTSLKPFVPHIYELFRRFGISPKQTDEVISLLGSQTGKYIYTSTHRLLNDRGKIIVTEKTEEEPAVYVFSSLDEMRISGIYTDMHITEPSGDPLPVTPLTASLDLDRITFPVTVRHWEPGDRFMPLGMKQMKKISDFLIDLKVPVTEKEKVLLLLSGQEVIWVMGYRIDDRFRVTNKTGKILVLTV
jgi:tRNA(Ile)-lysidine synthase